MKVLAAGETVAKELARPQEPKPPFPYEATDVAFENAAAHAKLAGTLTAPKGDGPVPVRRDDHGSGPQDRDEALLGHRPFLVIADHLTRHGVAVLRYDDRGVAKSTGSFDGATSDDFAADALAAVEFLKTRKEIDPKRIGILGHSEGGLIAPMCAAKSKDVAFLVLLAGTGIRGVDLMPIQAKLVAVATGTAGPEAELQAKDTADVLGMIVAGKSDAEVRERIHVAVARAIEANPERKGLSADERAKKWSRRQRWSRSRSSTRGSGGSSPSTRRRPCGRRRAPCSRSTARSTCRCRRRRTCRRSRARSRKAGTRT
jgi:alpha/beta superfamily hydrolase